jgi:hypothetical protein
MTSLLVFAVRLSGEEFTSGLSNATSNKCGEIDGQDFRLAQVLAEAKTEHGRAQILIRSALAKFRTARWIIGSMAVLILFPLGAAWLKDLASTNMTWLHSLHDGVVAAAALLIGATSVIGTLVRAGSQVLDKLEGFRKAIESKVEQQRRASRRAANALSSFVCSSSRPCS